MKLHLTLDFNKDDLEDIKYEDLTNKLVNYYGLYLSLNNGINIEDIRKYFTIERHDYEDKISYLLEVEDGVLSYCLDEIKDYLFDSKDSDDRLPS